MPPTSPPPSASCRKRTRRGPRNEAAGLRLHLRRPPGRCLREPAASAPPQRAGRRGWRVRLGDFIGQNGGKVTGIHRDEMVITETITDHSTGRVYPQNVKLQVPVTREEEKDFKALQEGEHMGVAKGDQ